MKIGMVLVAALLSACILRDEEASDPTRITVRGRIDDLGHADSVYMASNRDQPYWHLAYRVVLDPARVARLGKPIEQCEITSRVGHQPNALTYWAQGVSTFNTTEGETSNVFDLTIPADSAFAYYASTVDCSAP